MVGEGNTKENGRAKLVILEVSRSKSKTIAQHQEENLTTKTIT